MRNFIFTVLTCILIFGFGISSCKSKGSSANNQTNNTATVTYADNSKNSLDWVGTYTGIVPCANCSGIFTQITLKNDSAFSLQMKYVGKEDSTLNFEGTFQWNDAGSIITFNNFKEESIPTSYLVGENKLIQLDLKGNVITGDLALNYVLTKVNENLVGKKWKLFGLKGIILSAETYGTGTEAFIIFQVNGNRINGNSGCNNFTGTYKIESGNKLHFSDMASTRKMCLDMTVEDLMNELFRNVDNYTLQHDTLSLNQGETILAQFMASE